MSRHRRMDPHDRFVTFLPLSELWTVAGPVDARVLHRVEGVEIVELLRWGPVSLVIAALGRPLRWVGEDDYIQVWKAELKGRICTGEGWFREDYPGGYFYLASEWRLGGSVLVLEKHD